MILSNGGRDRGALEQHPLGIFMSRVEEPIQSSVLRRIELPQVELPLLAREYPADEHNLDYVGELELLVHHALDARLQRCQLVRRRPIQALLFPGGEPRGDSGSEFGGRHPVGVAWLGDVEPPRLPSFYGLRKGAVKPCDVGHSAHHGPFALRLLASYHLRLHAESLQP